MISKDKQLDFSAVDGIGFAIERARLDNVPAGLRLRAENLGPLLELAQYSLQNRLPGLPPWLDSGDLGDIYSAVVANRLSWASLDQTCAMMALSLLPVSNAWTVFAMRAKRAAVSAGFDDGFAGQMVAALRELEDNIREHAGTVKGAFLAYRGRTGIFEFVVADQGTGVLSTLRTSPDMATLASDGEALEAALKDGVSRFGSNVNRGHGYRPLFTGLINRRASLRFRSGSAALSMSGITPNLPTAQIGQKPQLGGFFASITCHARVT